jgi:hypothetical protein
MDSGEAWLSGPSLEFGDIEIFANEIWNAGYDNVNATSDDYAYVDDLDKSLHTDFDAQFGGQSYSEVLSRNLICGPPLSIVQPSSEIRNFSDIQLSKSPYDTFEDSPDMFSSFGISEPWLEADSFADPTQQ